MLEARIFPVLTIPVKHHAPSPTRFGTARLETSRTAAGRAAAACSKRDRPTVTTQRTFLYNAGSTAAWPMNV